MKPLTTQSYKMYIDRASQASFWAAQLWHAWYNLREYP